MISISQTAAKEIKRIQLSRQQPDSQLRLTVKSGGCSGLFYIFTLEPKIVQSDSNLIEEANYLFQSNGVQIIVDQQTYLYLEGLQLDYSEDLMGGGFRFQNPNAVSTCGCGLSFAYKNNNSNS